MRNDDLIYVGIGINEYATQRTLSHAVADVEGVQAALDDDGTWVKTNPTHTHIGGWLYEFSVPPTKSV